jgi:hypothetical protein
MHECLTHGLVLMDAVLARLARQPGKNYFVVYMYNRASPVPELSLEKGEISLTAMSLYKHSLGRELFSTTVKTMSKQQNCRGKRDEIFSHINTR